MKKRMLPSFSSVTLRIDNRRRLSKDGTSSGILLMYDPLLECYYETTINEVVGTCMAKIEEKQKENEERLSSLESEVKSTMGSLSKETKEKQDEFIKSTSTTMTKLIDLVEAIKGDN